MNYTATIESGVDSLRSHLKGEGLDFFAFVKTLFWNAMTYLTYYANGLLVKAGLPFTLNTTTFIFVAVIFIFLIVVFMSLISNIKLRGCALFMFFLCVFVFLIVLMMVAPDMINSELGIQ